MANALQPVIVEEEEDTNEEWLLALLAVLLLVNGSTARPLTAAQRRRARTLLRSKFESDANRLAVGVTGAMAVAAWLTEMQTSIGDYARQMAVAGAGTLPIVATRALVDARLREQLPFLTNFGRVVAQGTMSVRAIAARSRLYGNSGHAAYFMGQGSNVPRGYVERWKSQDDGHVCRNCAPLHNETFLPGQGPMPGVICLGACRCTRILEYNPDEYVRLAR